MTLSGTVNIGSSTTKTLTVTNTGVTTFSGVITNNAQIIKAGAGVLVFSANNLYTNRTTVSEGKLLVNNTTGSGAGAGSVLVNAPGMLGGIGFIAGPVSGNGTIAPGQGVGTLTLGGGLDLSSGGTCIWELSALSTNGPGTNFDQLIVSGGNLALDSNAKLQLDFVGSAAAPNATNAFWQGIRSWRIIGLTGSATNQGASHFPTLINGSFGAGTFTNYSDAAGNIWLKFLPASAYGRPHLDPGIIGAGTSSAIVSWSSIEGQIYQLQCKDDLAQTNWNILGTITAPSNLIFFPDTNGPMEQRFYRVVIP